ncbi:hypothetical protein, partial [Amphritea sp.]|uniref:hypothetical protein n=1 Tax=Amphritea sp. TaxID=1872502 RepID=UPI003D0FF61E
NDKVQANNTSRNARVEYQGKSFTIAELSDIAAVDYHALHSRIFKLGWSIEKAVNQPLRGQKK